MVKRALPASGSPGGGPLHGYELGRDGLDRIIELYDLLGSVVANPVVGLNGAVAITERDGPEHGLAVLETIVGMVPSLACRTGRQPSKVWPGRRGSRGAGNRRRVGAHRGERRLLLSRLLDVRPEAA